jgi:hypothetical protein
MIQLTDGAELDVYIPQSLNECSLDQLLILQKIRVESEDVADFSVDFFRLCMPDEVFDELVALCDVELLGGMAVQAADMFLQSEGYLTMQKIPELLIKDTVFVGPKDCIANLCFGQFVEAETQFLLYFKTQKEQHLNSLVSILYRPRGEISYNNETNAAVADGLKKVELEIKLIIHAYYLGCREYLNNRFKVAFPKKKANDKAPKLLFSDITKMQAAYNAKMVQYAKSPERKKEVFLENVYTVFEFIEYDILEYQEMVNQLKK